MKLCRDCKHYRGGGHCSWGRDTPMVPDYVNGGMREVMEMQGMAPVRFAQKERERGHCTPIGTHFEPNAAHPTASPGDAREGKP